MAAHSICLVTNELFPLTHGGCGTLLSNSIVELLDGGHKVFVLADLPASELEKFPDLLPLAEAQKASLTFVAVSEALKRQGHEDPPRPDTPLRQSWRYWQAMKWCLENHKFDLVEFPDYKGWAYFTLSDLGSNPRNDGPAVVVRHHLCMEQIDDIAPTELLSPSRFVMYQLERFALSRCDAVLFPSEAIRDLVQATYSGLSPEQRCEISPPSFAAFPLPAREPNDVAHRCSVLFYSRLAPQKGAELFVDAAVQFLEGGEQRGLKFVVAGPDQLQAPTGGSVINYLKNRIPHPLRDRFVFTGNLDRKNLLALLPDVLFAVVPSRNETFCYAARELMMAGVPLIVSRIPAFEDIIGSGDVLPTELNAGAIADAMETFANDSENRARYEKPWVPPPALGRVYDTPPAPSGTASTENHPPTLTVVVLNTEESLGQGLLPAVQAALAVTDDVVVATPDPQGQAAILGRQCRITRPSEDRTLTDATVGEALCFVMGNDRIDPDYLQWAVGMLAEDPNLGIVGADVAIDGRAVELWDRHPWDAAPELLPFLREFFVIRAVVRGQPGPLTERICPEFADFQEISGIWDAVGTGSKLLRRPETMIVAGGSSDSEWREAVEPGISTVGLRRLLDRAVRERTIHALPKALESLIAEGIQGAGPLGESPLAAVRKGFVPEIAGMRLGLKGLVQMTWQRVMYLASKRPDLPILAQLIWERVKIFTSKRS